MEIQEREIGFLTVPFGPQHPASGHFHALMKVDGETVLELEPHPGYLHRGFEKLMEYRVHPQNCVLADRLDILDPFPCELGYVNSVEKIAGLEVPLRAKYIRTIMTELGRILSHVTWIGILSMVLGFDSANKITWGDREKILRLNEMATGGRVYPCYLCVGGVRRDISPEFIDEAYKILDYLEKQVDFYNNFVFTNETFFMRMSKIGIMNPEKAVELGATGPNLRACGIDYDVRKDEPYEAYPDVEFNVITRQEGDAYARVLCRRDEIRESISIVRQLMNKLPSGDYRINLSPIWSAPEGESYFCMEAARGEKCFYMVSDGTPFPYRVKVRPPSLSHSLVQFPYLAKGLMIADIPALYWSLDPGPADVDR